MYKSIFLIKREGIYYIKFFNKNTKNFLAENQKLTRIIAPFFDIYQGLFFFFNKEIEN
jgi:hypothetical protein